MVSQTVSTVSKFGSHRVPNTKLGLVIDYSS